MYSEIMQNMKDATKQSNLPRSIGGAPTNCQRRRRADHQKSAAPPMICRRGRRIALVSAAFYA